METNALVLDKQRIVLLYLYSTLFNSIIAVFLSVISFASSLWISFVFSQCIGNSICTLLIFFFKHIRERNTAGQIMIIASSIVCGGAFGFILGTLICGKEFITYQQKHYDLVFNTLIITIIFGSVIIYLFLSRVKMLATQSMIQHERIERIEAEKKAVQTQLQLLQAQIEPHFLFNTLSNIISLLETDCEKGKSMLMDLDIYLRASLYKSRQTTSSISQELKLIRSYLNLFKVRMGDRLQYSIDIHEDILNAQFPPMLIQPLVENSIKHGLEPKIEGGRIDICARLNNDFLRIEIADTGNGLHTEYNDGFGINNIRERLASIYGNSGRFFFIQNEPCGLRAVVEVPYESD